MKELLDKLSSYNIFNFLLPGIIFVYFVDSLTIYKLTQENLVIGIPFYYFLGLVCSRIGSLIIDPILKKIGFVKFSNYSEFIASSEKDTKIELLSEINNMYRTFLSVFLLIFVVKLYGYLSLNCSFLSANAEYIALFGLTFIFLYSYRKQTKYISSRIGIAT